MTELEPYKHVFSVDELESLADVIEQKRLQTQHPHGVVKLGTVRRHRTGLAIVVDRWTSRKTILYLRHDGMWTDNVLDVSPPKCEECDNLISEAELREYESEAGFEAGYPRICSRLHPTDER